VKNLLFICAFVFFVFASPAQYAIVTTKAGAITITYKDNPVFTGKLPGSSSSYRIRHNKQEINNALYQVISINSNDAQSFEMKGEIYGSDESIACESGPRDKGLRVVRHVVGQSHNLLNNAVYNRKQDWLLSFDNIYPKISITPAKHHPVFKRLVNLQCKQSCGGSCACIKRPRAAAAHFNIGQLDKR